MILERAQEEVMKDEKSRDEVIRNDLLNIMITLFAVLTVIGTVGIGVLNLSGFTNIFY